MNRRQLAVLQSEIGGIGQHHRVDQHRQQMRLMPRDPLRQIAAKAAARPESKGRRRPAPRRRSPAPFHLKEPKRTMTIETSTATTENTAEITRP